MRIDISAYKNIVVLTGAGISAGSGIRTYRGPGGVWDEYDVEEYGHINTLMKQPEVTWQLFGGLRKPLQEASPNAAHLALAGLEGRLRPDQQYLLITQNVDRLHQRAGSRRMVELHGTIFKTKCSNPSCSLESYEDVATHQEAIPKCPHCGAILRPDVVLFGEMLPALASWESKRALRDCDLFLSIGTSGVVSPASDFVRSAQYAGARTIYINLEPMNPPHSAFQETYLGKAEELLPELFGTPM